MVDLKGGADLSKPKPTVNWMSGAVVGVLVLSIAVGIGGYLYQKAKNVVPTGTSSVSNMAGELFGNGT